MDLLLSLRVIGSETDLPAPMFEGESSLPSSLFISDERLVTYYYAIHFILQPFLIVIYIFISILVVNSSIKTSIS